MDAMDQGKRKEKPKGGYRTRTLLRAGVLAAVVLVGAAYLLMKTLLICGCENPMVGTMTAIQVTNEWVAARLTETQTAANFIIEQTVYAPTPVPLNAVTVTATLTATPTPAADTVTRMPTICPFTWAHGDSPEDLAKVEAALKEANIEVAAVKIDAFGESSACVGQDSTGRFGIIDTTPIITFAADAAETSEARGTLIARILTAIQPLTLTKPRGINIVFGGGKDQLTWSMKYADAMAAVDSGLTGEALDKAGHEPQ